MSSQKSRELQLGMDIIDAHYTFNQSRLTISADGLAATLDSNVSNTAR